MTKRVYNIDIGSLMFQYDPDLSDPNLAKLSYSLFNEIGTSIIEKKNDLYRFSKYYVTLYSRYMTGFDLDEQGRAVGMLDTFQMQYRQESFNMHALNDSTYLLVEGAHDSLGNIFFRILDKNLKLIRNIQADNKSTINWNCLIFMKIKYY
ncbi:MAG: hypothetical protein IPO92_08105 [Saprospiraceae bacterium]|nr:hypothetical protein [Saprospiraceae bacterium]